MQEDVGKIFRYEADILVVGGGIAGLASALTAANEGASVVLFERASRLGGTGALSGGAAWIPNNDLMRKHGLQDARDDALRYLCRVAYPQYYDPDHATLGLRPADYDLIGTFYDQGATAVRYLTALGALDFEFDGTTPDYHSYLKEDRAPYGRYLPQPLEDDQEPGTGGARLAERLSAVAKRLGVQVLLDHRVWKILRSRDGDVFGLEVRAGLRTDLARARKAVIFASGGFLHNEELVRRHLPGRVFGGCAAPTSTGDFFRIGQELGAQFGNTGRAWWKQTTVEVALRSRMSGSFFLAFGDSMIFVNRYGKRVVNEKAPYHERAQIHSQWSPTGAEYPNLLLFMIWDEAVANHPEPVERMPVPLPEEEADYVISGRTWEELAIQLDQRLIKLAADTGGVRLAPSFGENLAETIAQFNEYALTGIDEEFHRGENEIEVKWHAPARPDSRNPTMAPFLDRGPYHCVVLGAGALDTNSGPLINAKAQVLDSAGDPIPGIYGAGNCVASIAGQAYWGAGGTIGPAITFGYLAALHATREPERRVDL